MMSAATLRALPAPFRAPLLALALCGVTLAGPLTPAGAQPVPPAPQVTAGPTERAPFPVRRQDIPEMKGVFGEVESRTVVPARARIGGTVHEVKVTEGSEVRKGDEIALVVDDKLALTLNAADAKIKELNSQLENARTELDRAQQLLAKGFASQSRVDTAKTQFDVAANQVAAAEADRAVVVQREREGTVLAPADGRVLTVPVTPGSVVLAGDEIARIASGQYYLRLSLPERHAADIREGGLVRIGARGISPDKAGGLATARDGRIVKVYPEITGGRVMADVDVAGLGDYFVNERTLVWIEISRRAVLAVPPEAVTTRHGVDYVRLITPQGPLDVAVVLGERFADGGKARVEVLTGLADGDKVVMP
ncbi:efflux RND transporter periplasmic adaptor subunit [Xanthobacter agilis]|uniref:RND family efflux transporter MFP subunit n=1 Tax=Xanthobacter agilis TaxID=47492 RepID=A0ABU0LD38_XANAG|nr:efflux RND transporter periplasmic adaptor subunit [Xanthobacter agilis]MDQ0505057.1 RND family efflux transporter MFP subunit [Xanthobacter agilis]